MSKVGFFLAGVCCTCCLLPFCVLNAGMILPYVGIGSLGWLFWYEGVGLRRGLDVFVVAAFFFFLRKQLSGTMHVRGWCGWPGTDGVWKVVYGEQCILFKYLRGAWRVCRTYRDLRRFGNRYSTAFDQIRLLRIVRIVQTDGKGVV